MKTQVIVSKENIDFNKFIFPYGNKGNNKPINGGFWTSSMTDNNKSGWLEFTEREDFYDDMSKLKIFQAEVSDKARVLMIDTKEDYEEALKSYGMPVDNKRHPIASVDNAQILDYEKLMLDYDALSLTANGLRNNYLTFYGWDCESTVWFNIDYFESIEQTL